MESKVTIDLAVEQELEITKNVKVTIETNVDSGKSQYNAVVSHTVTEDGGVIFGARVESDTLTKEEKKVLCRKIIIEYIKTCTLA